MSHKTANALLKQLAAGLIDGEQRSGEVCPFCEGGVGKERSFSISRQGTKCPYTCHRNSCNRKGATHVGVDVAAKVEYKEPEMSRFDVISKMLAPIPSEIEKMLREKYFFNATDLVRLDPRWSAEMKRLWMPILSKRGDFFTMEVGGVLRSFEEGVTPKTYNFINNFEAPIVSLYRNRIVDWRKIIIVEDQLSAVRACNTASSCALLGTNMNLSVVRLLANLEPEHVVFCLDPDAFAKSVELHKQWAGMFRRCTIVKPPKDLKNMDGRDCQEFIKAAFGD